MPQGYKVQQVTHEELGLWKYEEGRAGEDSFARVFHEELEKQIREIRLGNPKNLDEEIKAVNRHFTRIRRILADKMQEYMIAHEGQAGRWPHPSSNVGIRSKYGDHMYEF